MLFCKNQGKLSTWISHDNLTEMRALIVGKVKEEKDMKNMKRFLALATALCMTVGMTACGGDAGETKTDGAGTGADAGTSTDAGTGVNQTETPEAPTDSAGGSGDITLWTFPIGDWGGDYVNDVVAAFNAKYPDITVKVEYLDYASGDDQLTAAIEAGTAPDILMAEPQRLVKYGKNGQMVALDDMFTDEMRTDIGNEAIVEACSDGTNYWMYPLCITAHTMAINYEAWEESGALEYVNTEGDRTWTTEDFVNALGKLKEAGLTSGVVYCGGQGGDQGTRALVDNLYDAEFTNADHTEWTINSEKGIKGLQLLKDLCDEGKLSYDAGIAAADEIQLFTNGTIQMSFCWNAANSKTYAEAVTFTTYPLPFPSEDGKPVLESGEFGFGIFNNGDAAKEEAARSFIDFVCNDAEWGPKSVEATGFFPVRSSFEVYADSEDTQLDFYKSMLAYVGDNFTAMDGFTEQRTAWWTMLQYVFTGEKPIEDAANEYVESSNGYTASYSE